MAPQGVGGWPEFDLKRAIFSRSSSPWRPRTLTGGFASTSSSRTLSNVQRVIARPIWIAPAATTQTLRAEVEAMLAADAVAVERFVVGDEPLASESDPFVGMRLGPWLIVEVIGHGGMGTVYLAQRADGQYDQRVALKIVRSSMPPERASLRFKAETHILARLSHPNIARLLDAGLTPEGSAYLVMEHVDGCPVTEYCDARRLTVDERLRLFLTVCDATQHAHQSLVVHRDLKPSNILVSRSGEVKLLDFGIAKLLERNHPLADETAPELRALTPAYAAPEQIRGEPVTTATDVYVLGVVLYELMTGSRPPHNEPDTTLTAGSNILPSAPSTSVRRRIKSRGAEDRPAVAAVAEARRTTPARLARHLEGDIDRVVLKALQPEASRRYGSAGMLAEDIGRLLEGRPVAAQPDTVAYRVRRFIGRHRVGVAMTAVLFLSVVAFAILAMLQARAVAIERDRARLQASRAERVLGARRRSLQAGGARRREPSGHHGAPAARTGHVENRGAARRRSRHPGGALQPGRPPVQQPVAARRRYRCAPACARTAATRAACRIPDASRDHALAGRASCPKKRLHNGRADVPPGAEPSSGIGRALERGGCDARSAWTRPELRGPQQRSQRFLAGSSGDPAT